MHTVTSTYIPCQHSCVTAIRRMSVVSKSVACPTNIFELADSAQYLHGHGADVLKRIFKITRGTASCTVGSQLSEKYSVPQNNKQLVVSITNKWTYEQAWYNEIRSQKPQTFKASTAVTDPTGGGGVGKCDFCDWSNLTAQDAWGRFENAHAVTASNLFKYGEPFHGLALFKHHDPLSWTPQQLAALMQVAAQWFDAASREVSNGDGNGVGTQEGSCLQAASCSAGAHSNGSSGGEAAVCGGPQHMHDHNHNHYHNHAVMDGDGSMEQTHRSFQKDGSPSWKGPLHGFLIWNALARAGASQYHGHAQLMATWTPVPAQALLDDQASAYTSLTGRPYLRDLMLAHGAVGLLRACAATPAEAEAASSNGAPRSLPAGKRAWVAASLSPTKDMEVLIAVEAAPANDANSNIGTAAAGLGSPAFTWALHAALRALIDTLGSQAFNVGILNVPCGGAGSWENGEVDEVGRGGGAHDGATQPPLMLARVVSRGLMSSLTSDYGSLEVIGGASIGHTDPYVVIAAVEAQLGECLIPLDCAPL